VIRPGWDVGEVGWNCYSISVGDHRFYYTRTGVCITDPCAWEGMQHAREAGDRIGMLLDLDQGSMTVYKNAKRLGVMATGLSGEYSWAATLCLPGDSARIEAAEVPASRTGEELK
jgi:hypothetical protein